MKLLRGFWFEAVLVLAILLVLTFAAHGAVGKKQPDVGLGVVLYTENPNLYMFASIHDAALIERGAATNVEFSPAHTSLFFTQTILFCGNRAVAITDNAGGILRGPLVITYRRAASRLVDGVPCHDLVSVDKIKEKVLP